MGRMMSMMDGESGKQPPFAPPFLQAGKLVIAQTANILFYLGPRLKLAPRGEPARLWLHGLQLTVADFVKEIHDTHHPLGNEFYYEDAKPEAKRFTENFLSARVTKYLGYFEDVLEKSGGPYALGRRFQLCRSVAVPADRRAALRLSPGDEADRAQGARRHRRARPRRGTAAHQEISRLAAPHRLQ